MKIIYIQLSIAILLCLTSCYKDLGNYEYADSNTLIISDIPDQINVLGSVDTLRIIPKVTSTLEGEIDAADKNYSFVYATKGQLVDGRIQYTALDSTYPKDLNYFVKLQPAIHDIIFVVTDNRTGVQQLKRFKLNVSSAVSEGWMVLSNEGETDRVRMDMISVISPTRSVQAFDLAASLGLPPINKATRLSYVYQNPITAKIAVHTQSDGAFNMAQATLQSGPSYNMLYEFGNKKENCKPQIIQRVTSGYYLVVDGDNNVYAQYHPIAGPIFQFPVNTSVGNRKPEFKISPYIAADPRISNGSNAILAYDMTNLRFVDWSSGRNTMMLPLVNPEQPLFDYGTGKNLVYMGASLYGNSTAYAVMEKNGQYSLYGMTFVPRSPVGRFEQSLYAELNIPEIGQATSFAFHSTLPYMFYAAGSKLYQYDIVSKQTKVMQDFGSEKISMLKFNLFRFNILNKPKEYLDQQYQLIVGTHDNKSTEKSNGVLRFFNVPPLNGDLTEIQKYRGFAKIVDVAYKEKPVMP